MQIKECANNEFLPEVIRLCREGHTVTINLKGYSMRPFLEHGRDKAVLAVCDAYRVGDAVLAHVPIGNGMRRYVLHRIISIEGDNVILLGDGNLSPEYCSHSDIKAKAIGFYRKRGGVYSPTDGWRWRVYSAIWMRLPVRSVRRVILAIIRRIR